MSETQQSTSSNRRIAKASRLGASPRYSLPISERPAPLPTVTLRFPELSTERITKVAPSTANNFARKIKPRPPTAGFASTNQRSNRALRVRSGSQAALSRSLKIPVSMSPKLTGHESTTDNQCDTPNLLQQDMDFSIEDLFKSLWFRDKAEWKQVAQKGMSHGKSVYFEGDTAAGGEWKDCRIVGYSPERHKRHPPFSLDEYVALHQESLRDALTTVKFEWRQQVVEQFTLIYDSFPKLTQLIKRVDYIVATHFSKVVLLELFKSEMT
ncbi:hypothetical protein AC1031_013271 [Aphanomyces cochlioides]|nr:hypothetical protein AC1031_013271 [Aphanomyces cochlioides]